MYTTSIVVYHAISPLVETGVDVKELVFVVAREDVLVTTGLIVEGQVTTMELIVIGLVVIFGQFLSLVFPVLKQKVKKILV